MSPNTTRGHAPIGRPSIRRTSSATQTASAYSPRLTAASDERLEEHASCPRCARPARPGPRPYRYERRAARSAEGRRSRRHPRCQEPRRPRLNGTQGSALSERKHLEQEVYARTDDGSPQLCFPGLGTVIRGPRSSPPVARREPRRRAQAVGDFRATATTGCAGGLLPSEPWKATFPKAKMPPSSATMRYPALPWTIPETGLLRRIDPVDP